MPATDTAKKRFAVGQIIFFGIVPAFPLFLILMITWMIFNDPFVARHLDIVVVNPARSDQYFDLQDELVSVRVPLAAAREAVARKIAVMKELAASQTDPATSSTLKTLDATLGAAAAEVDKHARSIEAKTAIVADRAQPVALTSRALIIGLRSALGEATAQTTATGAAIESCACSSSEIETLSAARARLDTSLTSLTDFISAWSVAKARQSGAMMKAVNATVILTVVAAGAALWCCAYLLPSRLGGARFGGLGWLRWGTIAVAFLVFLSVLLAPRFAPHFPLIPYRTVTFTLFDRTLALGLHPGGGTFIWWNYASIGLVGAALFAAYATMAITARTYRDPPVRSIDARRRMAIVRNVLYLAAIVSVAALLAIDTDFTAAASLFAGKSGDIDNPTQVLINEIGGAVVQAHGIGLGLGLAIAYLTASHALRDDYEREKKAASEEDDKDEGLAAFLTSGNIGMALRFLVIIAPAAVGGIIQAIGTN